MDSTVITCTVMWWISLSRSGMWWSILVVGECERFFFYLIDSILGKVCFFVLRESPKLDM